MPRNSAIVRTLSTEPKVIYKSLCQEPQAKSQFLVFAGQAVSSNTYNDDSYFLPFSPKCIQKNNKHLKKIYKLYFKSQSNNHKFELSRTNVYSHIQVYALVHPHIFTTSFLIFTDFQIWTLKDWINSRCTNLVFLWII